MVYTPRWKQAATPYPLSKLTCYVSEPRVAVYRVVSLDHCPGQTDLLLGSRSVVRNEDGQNSAASIPLSGIKQFVWRCLRWQLICLPTPDRDLSLFCFFCPAGWVSLLCVFIYLMGVLRRAQEASLIPPQLALRWEYRAVPRGSCRRASRWRPERRPARAGLDLTTKFSERHQGGGANRLQKRRPACLCKVYGIAWM